MNVIVHDELRCEALDLSDALLFGVEEKTVVLGIRFKPTPSADYYLYTERKRGLTRTQALLDMAADEILETGTYDDGLYSDEVPLHLFGSDEVAF